MEKNNTPNKNETISAYGNGLAFGLSGTKEEIELQFNRWFNIGAAGANVTSNLNDEGGWTTAGKTLGDGFLHYVGENFAYFLTTEKDLVKALAWENVRLWQDSPISEQYRGVRYTKKQKGQKFLADAEDVARDIVASIKRENFMGWAIDREPQGHAVREGQSDWCNNE